MAGDRVSVKWIMLTLLLVWLNLLMGMTAHWDRITNNMVVFSHWFAWVNIGLVVVIVLLACLCLGGVGVAFKMGMLSNVGQKLGARSRTSPSSTVHLGAPPLQGLAAADSAATAYQPPPAGV